MTISTAPKIQVRPYSAIDRDACIAIFRSNLPHYFDSSELSDFEAFLDELIGEYFVFEIGGSIIASGGCYVHDHVGHLSWGMVLSAKHRASIGTTLLVWRVNHLFRRSEIAEISIDTSQHTAEFFKRFGFHTTQNVVDGFGVGIDKVSMSLHRNEWQVRANYSF